MSNYPGALSGGFVSHRFQSLKADTPDPSIINSTQWNQSHIIGSGAIQSGALGASMVNSGNITSGAIIFGALASGAVSSGGLAANSVVSGDLASGAVTYGSIASGAVSSGAVGSGSVLWNPNLAGKPFVLVTPNGPTDGGDYGPNTVGTTTGGIQEAINASRIVFIVAGSYSVSNTITISKPTSIFGAGQGTTQTSIETPIVTELKWAGTTNNIPMFKLDGSTSALTGVVFQNLKLFYTGTATGTDAIYADGTTSVGYSTFNNVVVQGFTGYGIHSIKTVFAFSYYGIYVFGCSLGCVFIDGSSGVPSQHWFYGCTLQTNVAGIYAVTLKSVSTSGFYGGAIANAVGGGNGALVTGGQYVFYGVNIEGSSIANTIGINYTGTTLIVEGGGLSGWTTGLKVGDGTANAAGNSRVDTYFSANTTDLLITNGGLRSLKLGSISTASLSTITDNRQSIDGVYTERTNEYYGSFIPALAAITVGGSPFTYQNTTSYNIMVYVFGGTVSSITVAGTQIAAATNVGVFLAPGQVLVLTYSAAPTMVRSYAGP